MIISSTLYFFVSSLNYKQAKLCCNRVCLFLGEALNCSFCYSNKSWYECDSRSEQRSCTEHKVCIKLHRQVKQGENEIHHYSKGCLPSSNCNGEVCKDHGQSCQIDCCNTDGCNGSMFLNANYMTLLTFALLIIVHFLWIFCYSIEENFADFVHIKLRFQTQTKAISICIFLAACQSRINFKLQVVSNRR